MLQKTNDTVGTSYIGSIYTTYSKLVKAFGPPHHDKSADNKVQAEWGFLLRGNIVVTIYDYKAKKSVAKITNWHIGSRSVTDTEMGVIANFLAEKGFTDVILDMDVI